MKYVFLAYHDKALLDSLPAAERDVLCAACAANDEALRASGYLLAAGHVQGSDTAITVRVQNGDLAVDAEPIAQLHEQLSSLFFVEARDLNEAIQIASQMPQARSGPIEVWPLVH